jgi:hypothetical protein
MPVGTPVAVGLAEAGWREAKNQRIAQGFPRGPLWALRSQRAMRASGSDARW